MYECTICNYKTPYSGNFSSHIKTIKHCRLICVKSDTSGKTIETIHDVAEDVALMLHDATYSATSKTIVLEKKKNKNFICEICSGNFKHHSSYYRHKKTCTQSTPKDDNITINELEMKLQYSEKEKEMFKKLEYEKDEIIKEKTQLLNTFMANANHIINKANDNTKITAQAMQTVSVSALKYANDNFNNAPVLMPLENFNINNLSFDNEQDREQLIETLIYNAKQKSLDKLLGDHIVKCYKKENPEEQSFHTTDCSRLNYIVCNLIENALTWAVDKSGIKICSSIVKPLIEKCINLLLEYQKTLINKMAEGDYKDKDTVHTILNLLMTIDKGCLESDINKYIAPFFNLTKT
jgi:hypothetical protein